MNAKRRDADELTRKFISKRDVAKEMQVTPKTVERRVKREELPQPVSKRPTLFLLQDIVNHLKNQNHHRLPRKPRPPPVKRIVKRRRRRP